MIKKISIISFLFLSFVITGYADEKKTIKLDDKDHKKEIIETENFNIILELKKLEKNEYDVKIDVELENLDESKILSIFDKAYDEKQLKKMQPSIIYEKYYPGSKENRKIEACDGIKRPFYLKPSEKDLIMTLSGRHQDVTKFELPIYITKEDLKIRGFKGGPIKDIEQLVLKQKETIELEIDVELKVGKEYDQIALECDNLLNDLKDTMFCTNAKHVPTLDEQKSGFQKRLDSLMEKIGKNLEKYNWSDDNRNIAYKELKNKLGSIDLSKKEHDCGKHVIKPKMHSCQYCNTDLKQISYNLDDIYQTIYNSSNKRAEKEKYKAKVNAMYNCAKRRKDWKRSEYKSQIEEFYNKISQF